MSYTFELVGVHLQSIGNFDKIQTKANAEVKRYGQIESVKEAIKEQKRINEFSKKHREIVATKGKIDDDAKFTKVLTEPVVVDEKV